MFRECADRITFCLGKVIEKLPHCDEAHLAWMTGPGYADRPVSSTKMFGDKILC